MTQALPPSPAQPVRHYPRTLRITLLLLLLVAVTLLPARMTMAATLTLMDENLKITAIHLQHLDDRSVTFLDENGQFRTLPVAQFVQLRLTLDDKDIKAAESASKQPEPNATPDPLTMATTSAPGTGQVELIDGQLFTGRYIASDEKGQIIHWQHPLAGNLTFSSIWYASGTLIPPPGRARRWSPKAQPRTMRQRVRTSFALPMATR